MYLQYFSFSKQPFGKDIKVGELFSVGEQKEALARMEFVVREKGMGLILGDVGSGKSTLFRALVEKIDQNRNKVIYTASAKIGKQGFFRDICIKIGLPPTWHFFNSFLKAKERVMELYEEKKINTVLLVDEVQEISFEILEAVRLFSNYEMDSKSPLCIIMAGQNHFAAKLKTTTYQPLNQRISVRFHLKGLTLSESINYIKHQTKIAGCSRPLFEDEGLSLIYEVTRGIPRKINLVCTHSLQLAAVEDKEIIGKDIVQRVLKDINGAL